MTLCTDPTNRQPNVWYDLSPIYSGDASIVYPGSDDNVDGIATFAYEKTAGREIVFECKDDENSRLMQNTMCRGQPGVVSIQGPATPESITIETNDGRFVANHEVFSERHIVSTHRPSSARFTAIGSTFQSSLTTAPAHFVLPLYNMLSPSFETWPKQQPDCINTHKLRIFPTPPSVAEQTDFDLDSDRNWHNRLVTFKIDEQVGFIEPLPDYSERAERLRAGSEQRLITAILVCDAASRRCAANDQATWFPIDILNLLSLATGHRVGAPWIEYRDDAGHLLERVHVAFCSPDFQCGHPLFLEDVEANTGYFVTRGLEWCDLSSKVSRLMIAHLINAGKRPRSIEDRFLSLARAFETFATNEGLSVQEIGAVLSSSERSRVIELLDNCCQDLRCLEGTIDDPNHKKSVRRIADRVRSADQKDKNFGDLVADISERMGFHDKDALLRDFTSSQDSNWCAYLSFLRGAVVHEGGFDFLGGTHNAKEIVGVANHLHDLLIRVFLKLLGSQAHYSSPIWSMRMPQKLDWVTPTTASSKLIVDL